VTSSRIDTLDPPYGSGWVWITTDYVMGAPSWTFDVSAAPFSAVIEWTYALRDPGVPNVLYAPVLVQYVTPLEGDPYMRYVVYPFTIT